MHPCLSHSSPTHLKIMQMRVTFNAQERTLREISALALSAGWKIVDVVPGEGSLFGHLTAVPVEIPAATLAHSGSASTVTARTPGTYLPAFYTILF